MTRDEIYDHLAQVYLGKKNKIEQKRKQKLNAWLVINVVITVVIFASSFYAFSAFLSQRGNSFQNKIIYALNRGPIRVKYDLSYPHPPVETFSLVIPYMSVAKYKELQFSLRGMEEGFPGTIRVEIKNQKNEVASIFIEGVGLSWQEFNVPLSKFESISDWSQISEVSFIIESWNADRKKGIILIDNVCFSG